MYLVQWYHLHYPAKDQVLNPRPLVLSTTLKPQGHKYYLMTDEKKKTFSLYSVTDNIDKFQ